MGVRARQHMKMKEEMCFILRAFCELTQLLHGLWCLRFIISYVSFHTLIELFSLIGKCGYNTADKTKQKQK